MVDDQLLRDTGVPGVRPSDQRALEIVAYDLPLFHGIPLCCDATLVSPLKADGQPAHRSDAVPGSALVEAERRKRRTYWELASGRHARLLVLGNEIGGRWSEDALAILPLLAEARARSAPRLLHGQIRGALVARWSAMIAVTVQDAVAAGLSGEGCRGLCFPADAPPQWGEL